MADGAGFFATTDVCVLGAIIDAVLMGSGDTRRLASDPDLSVTAED